MKKKLIIIIIVSVILLGLTGYLSIRNYKKKVGNLLFIVTDISCDCISNKLNVYDNNTYKLDKVGSFTIMGYYEFDMESLVEELKNYDSENNPYSLYQIEFANGKQKVVSSEKLQEFLDSLAIENMFYE